jgi:hypothetical protein
VDGFGNCNRKATPPPNPEKDASFTRSMIYVVKREELPEVSGTVGHRRELSETVVRQSAPPIGYSYPVAQGLL